MLLLLPRIGTRWCHLITVSVTVWFYMSTIKWFNWILHLENSGSMDVILIQYRLWIEKQLSGTLTLTKLQKAFFRKAHHLHIDQSFRCPAPRKLTFWKRVWLWLYLLFFSNYMSKAGSISVFWLKHTIMSIFYFILIII